MKLKAWILTIFNIAFFFKPPLKPCVTGIYMYEGFVIVVVDLISQIFQGNFGCQTLRYLVFVQINIIFYTVSFSAIGKWNLQMTGIRTEMVLVQDLIWLLLHHCLCTNGGGGCPGEENHRGLHTWVCILSPLFTSLGPLNKSREHSGYVFIFNFLNYN